MDLRVCCAGILAVTMTLQVSAQIRQPDSSPPPPRQGSPEIAYATEGAARDCFVVILADVRKPIWSLSGGVVHGPHRMLIRGILAGVGSLIGPNSFDFDGSDRAISGIAAHVGTVLASQPFTDAGTERAILSETASDDQSTSSDGQTPQDNPLKPGTIQKHPDFRSDASTEEVPKRILGIIPNYRASPSLKDYIPLTPRGKFKMASLDSFDRGTFILGALFGGEAQLTKATPSFGQGVAAYARYFATSYADFVIGNFMTEAIYPTVLHQDPRYFRRGTGSVMSRLGYAAGQIFWTHRDSGGMQFNFSEIVGNSTAVAISNAYYPENRNASDAAIKLGIQVGVDMAGNILKEFSPELARAFSRKHHGKDDPGKPGPRRLNSLSPVGPFSGAVGAGGDQTLESLPVPPKVDNI